DALQKNIPPTDPRISQALANLATATLLQGNGAEAEKLYKQALDIATKSLGPNDPAVVRLTGNLGDAYTNPARYAKAEASNRGGAPTRTRGGTRRRRRSTGGRSPWRRRTTGPTVCRLRWSSTISPRSMKSR